ncbi:hypothetical protein GY45DRAFT_1335371 [Cubamyces sp. BRFM 1775]|nr:hypothetical protein GY45DRAFT_1335371 [Cubamyces sp. BRFM 1775]
MPIPPPDCRWNFDSSHPKAEEGNRELADESVTFKLQALSQDTIPKKPVPLSLRPAENQQQSNPKGPKSRAASILAKNTEPPLKGRPLTRRPKWGWRKWRAIAADRKELNTTNSEANQANGDEGEWREDGVFVMNADCAARQLQRIVSEDCRKSMDEVYAETQAILGLNDLYSTVYE